MTDDEKSAHITAIVTAFAAAYWERLRWQVGQFVPGADMSLPRLGAEDIFTRTMEPQEWLTMARYGAQLSDAEAGYIYEICQGVAEWLFAVPGSYTYEIPRSFAQSEFGALWAAALIRSRGDELITIAEAAQIAGVTVQAISQRIDRSTLEAFVDPFTDNPRKGRRLVKRSDVA